MGTTVKQERRGTEDEGDNEPTIQRADGTNQDMHSDILIVARRAKNKHVTV